MVRDIDVKLLTDNIKEMCIEATHYLSPDMCAALKVATETEESPLGKQVLDSLSENLELAGKEMIPICQDTGMAVVFLEIGQDVHFVGGNVMDAVNEGVRRGYVDGYLRKSVVGDPIIRENTKDNTPAILHTEIVPGDKVKITVADIEYEGVISYSPTEAREAGDENGNALYADFVGEKPAFAYLGSLADIKKVKASSENAIVIPKHLVKSDGEREYVQVYADGEKIEVDVVTGITNATEIEIISGLFPISSSALAKSRSPLRISPLIGRPVTTQGFLGFIYCSACFAVSITLSTLPATALFATPG